MKNIFNFKDINQLLSFAEDNNSFLPYSGSLSSLLKTYDLNGINIANRIAVQPMEGGDADTTGSPGKLTFRRYERYAKGANALIWFEATAVNEDGKSNKNQLYINEGSVDNFKMLVERTRAASYYKNIPDKDIYLVLQLTHSGRYAKPGNIKKPLAAFHNSFTDKKLPEINILTDSQIKIIRDDFINAADLAHKAGFNSVDIKTCHGYLLNDLLASYTRSDSIYGGPDLINRSRLLFEIIQGIRENTPELDISVRLNIYDGIPYPYGFGSDINNNIDYKEPFILIEKLINSGCGLLNCTIGVPSHNPSLGRPFDKPVLGEIKPDEHPLTGVTRFINIVSTVQKRFPALPIVGTGYSWLRHFYPYIAAGVLENKMATFIGLGRSSFAYPDSIKDIMEKGVTDSRKTCISCSFCSTLMRHFSNTGCVIRDRKIYVEKYKNIL